MSAVSDFYDDLISLLETKRGSSESHKNFILRFQAEMVKLYAHGQPVQLPDSMYKQILVRPGNFDNHQHVSILSRAP